MMMSTMYDSIYAQITSTSATTSQIFRSIPSQTSLSTQSSSDMDPLPQEPSLIFMIGLATAGILMIASKIAMVGVYYWLIHDARKQRERAIAAHARATTAHTLLYVPLQTYRVVMCVPACGCCRACDSLCVCVWSCVYVRANECVCVRVWSVRGGVCSLWLFVC